MSKEVEKGRKNFLKLFIILIVGSIILALLYIKVFFTKRPGKLKSFKESKPFKWYKVKLRGNVASSDGSKYFMLSKKGRSNNLMIFFSGGGSAWDANTASQPMGLANLLKGKGFGYYFRNIPFYTLSLLTGILDDKKSDNPFREWNVAYIPYSTADFHTGNNTVEYVWEGKRRKMRYNGRNNTLACLDWIFENYKKPEKVLICGESAGAFGSAFWTPKIAGRYKDSELYQFSDGAFLKSDKWPGIVENVWKSSWKQTFGYSLGNDPIKSAFINNHSLLGDRVTFMHSNTLYDGILASFQADLNGEGTKEEVEKNFEENNQLVKEWSAAMLECTAEIRKAVPNYFFYITNCEVDEKKNITTHTLMRYDRFFKFEEDGIRFNKWMADIILKDNCYSVGAKYLEAAENDLNNKLGEWDCNGIKKSSL